MRRIIVINTKGGCGKTTVATNLAACYAAKGFATSLLDYDPQGSSLAWLKARPAEKSKIKGVAEYDSSRPPLSGAWQLHVPRDCQRVIVDTQAGISASDLAGRISSTDKVLIPIQASAIDIRASAEFVRDLLLTAHLNPDHGRIGIVANRTRKNSQSLEMLERFLVNQKLPVVAYLRDALPYLTAADEGLGVCELPETRATREHRKHWEDLVAWLDRDSKEKPLSDTRSTPTITHAQASNESRTRLQQAGELAPRRRFSDQLDKHEEPETQKAIPAFLRN